MMRRSLVVLLSLLLVGWLAGCGEDGSTESEGNDGGNGGGGTQLQCTGGADLNYGGKDNALSGSCDKHVGVCESADDRSATDREEWYPCVDDPDCCCDTDTVFDPVGGVYGCENDSCIEDSYCDALCPQGQDPDC